MGIAASLFFSTSTPTECLDYRIRPTDEQYDAQKDRWNDLRDYLLADLQERSGYAMSSWLQGSYKFGTQVRPASKGGEFDIDLGVYYRWTGQPEDGDYTPTELKDFVQASLEVYVENAANDAEGVSAPKPRCNRVHFADNFHIDVPSYHLDGGRDARSLATQPGDWENSDPKAIYKWWKDEISDGERARARRLVRYMKMWAALKFKEDVRPSSILLTVLVAEAYRDLDLAALSGDDEVLRDAAKAVLARLRRSRAVANPANRAEDLNRLSNEAADNFVSELDTLVSVAERGVAAPSKSQAADIWAEAFHQFFPAPPEEEVLNEMARAILPVLFTPEIHVQATPPTGPAVFKGVNSIGPIPKDCDIKFEIVNGRDLPEGATVTWTVRNAGKEAEYENDMGHLVGAGLVANETSAYTGKHYMDVAVRRNGMLIGHRRVPVTIYGIKPAPRNAGRPGWVKFRQKRR